MRGAGERERLGESREDGMGGGTCPDLRSAPRARTQSWEALFGDKT